MSQESIRLQQEKLKDLEESFKNTEELSKNKTNAIKRLNLLLKLCNSDRMYSTSPAEEIMKELLERQNYHIQELENDRVSFIIDDFELELIPRKNTLMVKNIHRDERAAMLTIEVIHKHTEDYDIIFQMECGKLWPIQAAMKLAQLNINQGTPQSNLFLETIRNYFALKFTKKVDEICVSWNEEYQRREDSYKEHLKKMNESLALEIQIMKNNGLYDLLKLIENESYCFVAFAIFINKTCRESSRGVEDFLDKINKDKI